jgi:hypothetical protein
MVEDLPLLGHRQSPTERDAAWQPGMSFASNAPSVAGVNPSFDPTSLYQSVVTGNSAGSTSVSATATVTWVGGSGNCSQFAPVAVATPTSTPPPPPTICPPPSLVTGQSPTGTMACNLNQITFRWNAVAGADRYAIRIDETPGTWSGTCSSVNPGDTCNDNIVATSYTRSVTPGRSYQWWVDACDTCGGRDCREV